MSGNPIEHISTVGNSTEGDEGETYLQYLLKGDATFRRVLPVHTSACYKQFCTSWYLILLRVTWWTRWTLMAHRPASLWLPFQNQPLMYHKDQFEGSENKWVYAFLPSPFALGVYLAKIHLYCKHYQYDDNLRLKSRSSWDKYMLIMHL